MRTHAPLRIGARILFGALLLALPMVQSGGQIWILAALSTITVYEGATTRAVYGAVLYMAVSELLYGGDAGVASVGYVCAVVLFLIVRRFLAITAWSGQDGWRFGDGIRTLVASLLFSMVALTCGIMAGHWLFGYGAVVERLQLLWSFERALPVVLVCAVTAVTVRRIAIPFRREILFGT